MGIDQGKRPGRQQRQEARADTDFYARPLHGATSAPGACNRCGPFPPELSNSDVAQRDSLARCDICPRRIFSSLRLTAPYADSPPASRDQPLYRFPEVAVRPRSRHDVGDGVQGHPTADALSACAVERRNGWCPALAGCAVQQHSTLFAA